MPMPIAAFSPGSALPLPLDMAMPELVFLHIPKTAGTSQHRAFREHYGSANIFWIGKDCPPDIRRYPTAQIGERFVVGGHKRLAFYPRRIDPLYCAILRDPVERAISLFAYYTRPELAVSEHEAKVRRGALQRLQAKGMDPDSMLNSIRDCSSFRREIGNYQCRYLSRRRATLGGVQHSLRDSDYLIGTVASYDLFHRALSDLLDWAEAPPVQINRSRDNYAASYLQDAELVSRIRSLNREDEKLLQWVETDHQGLWLQLGNAHQRRRRLRSLPVTPGRRKASSWTWDDAPDLWPARGEPQQPWPLSRVMLAQPHRLIYVPTPGAAHPIIQRLMLELSSVSHKDAMLALGIDRVVEHFVTGLVLEDSSAAELEALAASSGYFRFAIMYEPVARLVEVYRQRFVGMREQLALWPRLYELVAAVQAAQQPDVGRGITFRQFVQAVTSGRHTHRQWLPQSRFLPWFDSYDRVYRLDQLPQLERDLERLRGLAVDIAAGVPPAPVTAEPGVARYADTLPGDLPADCQAWRDQLVDEDIYRAIKEYYAQDFRLYNSIANNKQEVA